MLARTITAHGLRDIDKSHHSSGATKKIVEDVDQAISEGPVVKLDERSLPQPA